MGSITDKLIDIILQGKHDGTLSLSQLRRLQEQLGGSYRESTAAELRDAVIRRIEESHGPLPTAAEKMQEDLPLTIEPDGLT